MKKLEQSATMTDLIETVNDLIELYTTLQDSMFFEGWPELEEKEDNGKDIY